MSGATKGETRAVAMAVSAAIFAYEAALPRNAGAKDALKAALAGTDAALAALRKDGMAIVPTDITPEMLAAWTRQHTPGERPTLQQRWQRALKHRPK